MRIRRPLVLALGAAFAVAAATGAGAQDNPATEARLLAIEGKFREADALIERAPQEVQDDVALRLALADMAMKAAATREGDAKRDPLSSARRHFAKVVELKPDNEKAAAGVLEAARALAEVHLAAKRDDEARGEAKEAIASGEKALAAGMSAPAFKTMLGRMYALRASFLKSMKDVDQLVSDSTNGANLLAQAADADGEHAGKLLSEASALRLRTANLVHEGIPKADEKRDDEALAAATELATKACSLKTADEAEFKAQLNALVLAHRWGTKNSPKPFMQAVTPPVQGLKLEVPRTGQWARQKSAADWDLDFLRDLKDPDNFGAVQVSVAMRDPNGMAYGKRWSDFAEVAQRYFEADMDAFNEGVSKVEPVKLTSKAGVEIWHYEIGGTLKEGGRMKRIAEWIGVLGKKGDRTLQIRMYDWRRVPDFEEPDIVAFVSSALGDGVWPPGSAGKEEPKGGKDPKKPPKK